MKILSKVLLPALVLLCFTPNLAMGLPADANATCDISVTVDGIMEWSGNFSDINLSNITSQSDEPNDYSTTTLYTNGDVDITADNTTTAQLSSATDTLVTEYKLEYDGDGASATGGSTVDWTAYNSFLSPTASDVTHYEGDGNVDVTLWAKAKNPAGEVADAGSYTATQTLTAAWDGG